WDRTTFLEQTCLKAGLPKHTFQNPRAEIYKFTVDRF
ncbi:MAG: AMMECR1 domain-containing protein, partial [candidate division Zixibacteria bacterium]|nr:AMMECR1 domain-containing protein [candidate division Zixibacteria bacterium]